MNMKKIKNAPAPLHRKFYMTGFLGLLCFLIGIAVYFFSRDGTMFLLSAAVCLLSIAKAYSIFRLVIKKEYEIVEGTCVGITPKPLRKYKKIRIMDDDGNESALLLSKQSKVKIGYRYRFFFKNTQRLTLGSEYFDSALSFDSFLGFEELGEFQTISKDK